MTTDSRKPHAGGILAICPGWEIDPDAAGLRIVAAARRWAEAFDSPLPLIVLVLGPAPRAGQFLGARGVKSVFVCAEAQPGISIQTIAGTVSRLAADQEASWIFAGAHGPFNGLAPLAAARLSAPLVSGCLALERDEKGDITAWRPLHQGRLFEEIDLTPAGVCLIEWEVNALPDGPAPVAEKEPVPAETIALALGGFPETIHPQTLTRGDPATLALEDAERILAIGRGVTAEGMALIEGLADRLSMSLGGTRPAVDQALLPYSRQIGQTGVSVSPRLLFACGISGANEFTVGITGAQTVVAVNTDSQARIFQMADLGLVGDWRLVLKEALVLLCDRKA